MRTRFFTVMPAQAGIQGSVVLERGTRIYAVRWELDADWLRAQGIPVP